MSKISVIVPVYNAENYLHKCLDSLCHQTVNEIEIICVDDCSTDNSLEIMHNFAEQDDRIRVVQRDTNGGQAAARQTGIENATGDYIGFVDSDDWVDADYYEQMVRLADASCADIVVNNHILVHEQDRVYPKNFPGHKQLELKTYDCPSTLIEKVWCVVWNKLFRADFLRARQYTCPVRSAHEDMFFHYATFAFATRVSFMEGVAYHYLIRETSVSHANADWGIEHLKVFSLIYDFYESNNLLNKKIKLYATMPFFNIRNAADFEMYKSYFQKISSYMDCNRDIFTEADLFIVNSVLTCANYMVYQAQFPANLMMIYLRRKNNKT